MFGTAAKRMQHLVLSLGDAVLANPSRPASFYQETMM
jgi:hypothetical protein